MYLVSSYYLDRIRVGGDDRRDIQVQEELRIDRMARDVWHDCRNRRETCDDKTDGGAFRKVPRSWKRKFTNDRGIIKH